MSKKLELPRLCYAEHPVTEETIKLVRNVEGYFPLEEHLKDKTTGELNAEIGITDVRIIEAMMAGSMFGWDSPDADPNNYDENLNLKKG